MMDRECHGHTAGIVAGGHGGHRAAHLGDLFPCRGETFKKRVFYGIQVVPAPGLGEFTGRDHHIFLDFLGPVKITNRQILAHPVEFRKGQVVDESVDLLRQLSLEFRIFITEGFTGGGDGRIKNPVQNPYKAFEIAADPGAFRIITIIKPGSFPGFRAGMGHQVNGVYLQFQSLTGEKSIGRIGQFGKAFQRFTGHPVVGVPGINTIIPRRQRAGQVTERRVPILMVLSIHPLFQGSEATVGR